ncbi:MlaD family protein [Synechococcus elongatus]|uniref:MlaD family protein n=1 Tax=Synechococcus elongatus TaxID=32046 RepID=UPI0030CC3182
MRSRIVREGSVGLMLIAGVGALAGLIFWLRGVSLNQNRYSVTVKFKDTAGLTVGTPVIYRGVQVGQVTDIQAESNSVKVRIQIEPATLVIPRDSAISAQISSLLGNPNLTIEPKRSISPEVLAKTSPRSPTCDPNLILCNGSEVEGVQSANLASIVTSIATLMAQIEQANLVETLNQTGQDAGEAARSIRQLSTSLQQEISPLRETLAAAQGAASEVEAAIAENRQSVRNTLTSLESSSQDLQQILTNLEPAIDKVNSGKLVDNLNELSANLAVASRNLRDVSTALNSPENLLTLQQTLDSARITFQNAQKITTDLNRLTGDPAVIENIRRLINSLGQLLSSTGELQEQVAELKSLPPLPVSDAAPAATVVRRPDQP